MGLGDITEKASDLGVDEAGDAAKGKGRDKGGDKIEQGQQGADARIGE